MNTISLHKRGNFRNRSSSTSTLTKPPLCLSRGKILSPHTKRSPKCFWISSILQLGSWTVGQKTQSALKTYYQSECMFFRKSFISIYLGKMFMIMSKLTYLLILQEWTNGQLFSADPYGKYMMLIFLRAWLFVLSSCISRLLNNRFLCMVLLNEEHPLLFFMPFPYV